MHFTIQRNTLLGKNKHSTSKKTAFLHTRLYNIQIMANGIHFLLANVGLPGTVDANNWLESKS